MQIITVVGFVTTFPLVRESTEEQNEGEGKRGRKGAEQTLAKNKQ